MIYVLEDDVDIREMESYALKNSGFDVMQFANSSSFFKAIDKRLPSLVLLDIMLPGEDGLAVLKKLRADDRTRQLPIMMVTAKTTELDKVKGLDMGADDYLTKPFGIMELVSRVKALLRRTQTPLNQPVVEYEGVSLDDVKHKVTANGVPVVLTFKEFELLKYLMANKDIVLSRENIMSKVWGFDFEGESRTVDMHIKTLRQKLGSCGRLIKTVRNVGYKLGE